MRVALVWLLLLTVCATNLAVAGDAHFFGTATSGLPASGSGVDPGVDPGGEPCQICLHGPALALLPEWPLPAVRPERPALPATPPGAGTMAGLPARIDEPPRRVRR